MPKFCYPQTGLGDFVLCEFHTSLRDVDCLDRRTRPLAESYGGLTATVVGRGQSALSIRVQ